jgi:hypothetical protein
LLGLPAAQITPLGDLDICQAGYVPLRANNGAGFTYQWTKDGINIPNAKNKRYNAKVPGEYKVIVTNSNGCSNTSGGMTVTKSCEPLTYSLNKSLSELPGSHVTISLYPNPSTGKVTVNYRSNKAEQVTLKIYDVAGKQVFSKSDIAVIGTNVYKLNLKNLVSGIYYLELSSKNSLQRVSMVISR